MKLIFARLLKAARLFPVPQYRRALFFGVGAAIEHERVLRMCLCKTIVDIGANRGQFALVARKCFPGARIVSFEPLSAPGEKYKKIFRNDAGAELIQAAVGPHEEVVSMHLSASDDSSSLLEIGCEQSKVFPGTHEVGTVTVNVAPLTKYLSVNDLVEPALLKIDVQGYEHAVLEGCRELLSYFEYVYCECSFVELYKGQVLAADVLSYLHDEKFQLKGVYNTYYDKGGRCVQADFLFARAVAK